MFFLFFKLILAFFYNNDNRCVYNILCVYSLHADINFVILWDLCILFVCSCIMPSL